MKGSALPSSTTRARSCLGRRALITAAVAAALASSGAATPAGAAKTGAPPAAAILRAGAAVVDITPPPEQLPVIQNGGFLEARASRVIDRLHARAMVLASGEKRVALVVVDSCMVPLDLCRRAKTLAAAATGIPENRILISATHTHSAPSAMDYCLGTRADPAYTASLPALIARAIEAAAVRLEPAEAGWAVADASGMTHCRRWILRPDRVRNDPFGAPTVRAMMHPGHLNPDFVGPAGPVDPALTLLAVRSRGGGRPIALLANFSMHYYGVGGGLSDDYFGRFAAELAALVAPGAEGEAGSGGGSLPVGILSQGTSGDLHWMDYGRPRDPPGIDAYSKRLARHAYDAYRGITFSPEIPLAMAESTIRLKRRTPDEARLAWAAPINAARGEHRPRNRPEVYAEQAVYLMENPAADVVLQAVRVGDFGLTAIPCEVYGITGLKLKRQSPFDLTMNLSLANGAAGYIPPPEQHALGGYTTWPARTAGLEVQAEPAIVDTVLGLLEQVAGKARKTAVEPNGPYAQAVLADRPTAYWRMADTSAERCTDTAGENGSGRHHGRFHGAVALFLDGPGAGGGAFSGPGRNRAAHFAGGFMQAELHRPEGAAVGAGGARAFSVELWFWDGLDGGQAAGRDRLLLEHQGERLLLGATPGDGTARVVYSRPQGGGQARFLGATPLAPKAWHHLALVRRSGRVEVFLNGARDMGFEGLTTAPSDGSGVVGGVSVGGRAAPAEGAADVGDVAPFSGLIDEVAVFPRALSAETLAAHYAASGLRPPPLPPRARTPSEAAEKPARAADLKRYADAVRASRPLAFWPLHETVPSQPKTAQDRAGASRQTGDDPRPATRPFPATYEGGAGPLPGGRAPRGGGNTFSGGRVRVDLGPLGGTYSAELWFWNALPNDARPVTAYLFSRGPGGELSAGAPGEHLGVGGTYSHGGRLIVFNGNQRNEVLGGRTLIPPRTWNHAVLVRDGGGVRVFLNGAEEPEIDGTLEPTFDAGEGAVFFGGRNDNFANLQGRLDQAAVYRRALAPAEVAAHFHAAGLPGAGAEGGGGGSTRARSDAPGTHPAASRDDDEGAKPKPAAPPDPPPLSPLEALAAIHVREGYAIELVAAEPLVVDPVAIDWGADGRLWVAEMADYPSGTDGKGKPGGRIRTLEDTDGDGLFDRSTLFLENVSFPTGVMAWDRGVLVTAAPDLFYAEDADGDGRADHRETLLTGFLPGNQQLRVNGLRPGLDNWIYCASGGHHSGYGESNAVRAPGSGASFALGSRDFRFRLSGRAGDLRVTFDPQSGPSQFGRNRDAWGNWFGVQNSRPIWHYVLADHYLRRNPHLPAPDPRVQLRGQHPRVFPAKPPQKRFIGPTHAGRFTSACSAIIYRGGLLFPPGGTPAATSGSGHGFGVAHAFTCEPFHNVVQHALVRPRGVTFEAERDPGDGDLDFFASTDRWTRPVMVRTGPDGALYIVDIYRYMIEHPQWLNPAGKEELKPFYRAGEERGRIYRIFPQGKRPPPPPPLAGAATADLVEALKSPSGTRRDIAQRLLIERADTSAVPALAALAGAGSDGGAAGAAARLHALCTLDGLGALDTATLARALGDPHPALRRHALRLSEGRVGEGVREGVEIESQTGLLPRLVTLAADPDPAVRLQFAFSLGAWDDPRASPALAEVAARDAADPFARAAALSSALPPAHFAALAAAAARDPRLGPLQESLIRLGLALGRRDDLAALVAPVVEPAAAGDPFTADQFTRASKLLDALENRQADLAALAAETDDALAGQLRRVIAVFDAARATSADATRPDRDRAAATTLLGRQPGHEEADLETLRSLLAPHHSEGVHRSAVAALGRLTRGRHAAAAAAALLDGWERYPPGLRSATADAALGTVPGASALVGRVEDGRIAALALDAAQRQRLLQHRDKRIAARARATLAATARPDRQAVIAAFQSALELKGDPDRGAVTFAARCAACHRPGDGRPPVGPDLRSLTDRTPGGLLAAIVDPGQSVDPRYLGYTATLKGGETILGIIAGESGNGLRFRFTGGAERTVLRPEIAHLENTQRSLMPDGLEAGLSEQDMADLLAHIAGEPE